MAHPHQPSPQCPGCELEPDGRKLVSGFHLVADPLATSADRPRRPEGESVGMSRGVKLPVGGFGPLQVSSPILADEVSVEEWFSCS